MKLISGLHPPLAGALTVEGKPVTGPLKSVGMAFQNSNLLPWRTALENVLLPLEIVEPYRSDFSKQKYAGKAQGAAGVRRPAGLYRKASLGALGRHAAARLDLPRADPRAGDPAARRAVRRARRVHARGAVVRAARPAGRAQGDGDAGDARPARGGVPRRHRVRDVEPAGAHRAALRGEPAAAARPGGDLHAAVPGHGARAAKPDRNMDSARVRHQGRLARRVHGRAVPGLGNRLQGAQRAAHHPAGALGRVRRAVAVPQADLGQLLRHAVDHARRLPHRHACSAWRSASRSAGTARSTPASTRC